MIAAPPSSPAPDRVRGSSTPERIRVLLLFTCGYFVSYLFRGINISFAPSLTRDTGLSAGVLGLVTSMYFLGFAAAQVPAGVLLDRHGSRKVAAALLLVAGAGAVVFGAAHGLPALLLGRLMIGVGVSVCLASAYKAVAAHFPAAQLPVVYGFVIAGGGLGGVLSGTPAVWLLSFSDRRAVCLGLALLAVATAVAIFLGTTDGAEPSGPTAIADELRGTWTVLSSRFFWRVAPFSVVTQGAFYATQSLWASAYMEDVSGLTTAQAARSITLIGVAMTAASIPLGMVARWLRARVGIGLVAFSGLCMMAFTLDQLVLIAGVAVPGWLAWSLFGVFGPAGSLTYAILAEAFPPTLAGRVNTTLTLLLFIAVFAFQWGIGFVVTLWPAQGAHHAAVAHRVAWGAIASVEVATSLLYLSRRTRLV